MKQFSTIVHRWCIKSVKKRKKINTINSNIKIVKALLFQYENWMFQKTDTTVYTVDAHQISEIWVIRWNYVIVDESSHDIVNNLLSQKYFIQTLLESKVFSPKIRQISSQFFNFSLQFSIFQFSICLILKAQFGEDTLKYLGPSVH